MDGAIDKVRERARKSVDERRGSAESASRARLSALLGRGARKLKRKEKNNTNINNGASTLGVNHSGESGELAFSDGRSEGSLLDEDDANSSLLTDDGSENDGYVWTPFLFFYLDIPCNTSLPLYMRVQCYGQAASGMHVSASACSSSSAPALASRTRTFRERSRISFHAMTCPDHSTLPMLPPVPDPGCWG